MRTARSPRLPSSSKGTPLAREIPGMMLLGPKRLAAMDERGIDVQALSINQYWWYEADRELADKIVRRTTRRWPHGASRTRTASSP